MTETRKTLLTTLILFTAIIMAALLPALSASALTNSSLQLSDPRVNETSDYTFSASNFDTGAVIRCIDLVLNTAADGSGSAVPDIDTENFDLGVSSTLITPASWTVDEPATGTMRLENGSGEAPLASGSLIYTDVQNGATPDVSYFAILTTYTDLGCSVSHETVVVKFIYTNGSLVSLTIDPTLTFTVNSVASGQTVNGATTTIASTPAAVAFGNAVTIATNGVSAHDLTVGTNADNGYSVYIRQTGDLTNGSHSMADNSGTNTAPAAFLTGENEGWGYTTQDATLGGGTADRFTNPANRWAAFDITNQVVADNTGPTGASTQTTRVGHQVGISSSTPAGTYQTTIIYTVASVY